MKKRYWFLIILGILVLIALSIFVLKNSNNKSATSYPYMVVYKTNGDYYNLVPVSLSEDESKVITLQTNIKYLANVYNIYSKNINDSSKFDKLIAPENLSNNYFLRDYLFMSEHTAFLNMTYEELIHTYPDLFSSDGNLNWDNIQNEAYMNNLYEELNNKVINREPFSEMYYCGYPYGSDYNLLNQYIGNNSLSSICAKKI